ncbi:acyltransferase family protein [Qipengyuania sp. DSG2-2]|uniref:acyltransferase family protein n=1 Tax=Qipengyuania sp. DGS2-2 TaxID=3349631 RepID=UPI0036D414A6
MKDGANRLDWLDGMRAWAIGLVALIHVGAAMQARGNLTGWLVPLSEFGRYGVQLFFVISAATITLTLARRPPVAGWYVRRAFRIAPLYYAAILFYGALMWLAPAGEPMTVWKWVLGAGANALFLHGFVPPAINSIVPGGWSIAVEMTFYAVAPLLVPLYLSGRVRLWHVLAACVAAVALTEWLASGVMPRTFLFFWPILHLPVFLIALFFIARERDFLFGNAERRTPLALCALMLAAGLGGAAAIGPFFELSYGAAVPLVGLGFAGLLLLAPKELRGLFANRIAVALGAVAYSVYICHFAVIRALEAWTGLFERGAGGPALLGLTLLVLALTYGAAWCTLRLIERPGIALGRKVADLADGRDFKGMGRQW